MYKKKIKEKKRKKTEEKKVGTNIPG